MTLNEYQQRAMQTCTETSDNFAYMMLNLVGEVGEFAGKVAKAIRKGEAFIYGDCHYDTDGSLIEHRNQFGYHDKDYQFETELMKEAGDILWQLAGLCKVMGWSLDTVAELNLRKLQARKKAGTIVGNGDGISGSERTA